MMIVQATKEVSYTVTCSYGHKNSHTYYTKAMQAAELHAGECETVQC